MSTKKTVVILLGPQGSGKGTQGKKLSEKLNIPYLETGQLLRDEISSGSSQGQYISSVINKGNLLPDEYISEFMSEKISSAIEDAGGVIVDGFPRRQAQADAFEKIADPTHVILVDITDAEAIRRLSARRRCPRDGTIYNMITSPPKQDEACDKCGASLEQRKDDTPESIKKRLNQYHSDTEPIVFCYEKKGVLHRIDGMPPIKEVEGKIWEIFE